LFPIFFLAPDDFPIMADPSVDPNLVPVSDETHQAAKIYLGVTVTLLTVALSTLIARIAFKLRSSARFGLDDYFIIVGFVSSSSAPK
jgi:nitrate reductase gamma subunit